MGGGRWICKKCVSTICPFAACWCTQAAWPSLFLKFHLSLFCNLNPTFPMCRLVCSTTVFLLILDKRPKQNLKKYRFYSFLKNSSAQPVALTWVCEPIHCYARLRGVERFTYPVWKIKLFKYFFKPRNMTKNPRRSENRPWASIATVILKGGYNEK